MASKEAIHADEKLARSTSEDRDTGSESLDLVAPVDRKLMNKIDLRLIPVLFLVWVVLFLDRTNFANARIEGLEKALHFPLTGFNNAIWIFYIPFVLVEVPLNVVMMLPSIKPQLYLGISIAILGIISMCQGLTKSYGGFLAVRFFMGIFEGSIPAASSYLFSTYYTRHQIVVRFGILLLGAPVGPCFSGLLAYAIRNMNGLSGVAGWRWIFIIEGLATIVIGILVALIIPDFPEKATFLTDEERSRLLARLRADKGKEKLDLKNIPWLKILTDYRILVPTLIFFCVDMTAASMSSFIPTILVELGWKAARAQVMSIPIWIVGMVFQVLGAFIAQAFKIRFPFVLVGFLFQLVGWVINVVHVEAAGVRYMSLFFLSVGTFILFTQMWAWLVANLRGRANIAVGTAFLYGLGNCANFVSANVFKTKERPKYPTGFRTGLGLTVAGFVLTLVYAAVLAWHNKKLEKKRKASGEWEDTQTEYKYML